MSAQPTFNEIQYLTPRVLTDAAKRAAEFHGFSPRELDIYLTGNRDGMEAKADFCHNAMNQFMDAVQATAGWMAARENERLHKEACAELNELRSTIAAGGKVEL